MLEYIFYKNEIGTPQFGIVRELQGLSELGSCNESYLEEIISSLEEVLNGELEQYDFGYEVYSIDCRKDVSQVVDTYNGWKSIAEIPTQKIYELIRDWKNYLLDYSNSLKINENNKISEQISINYTFFDGLKIHSVTNEYNDWLSSTDFSIWSNSYIQVDDNKLYIIKENVKTLSTFSYYDKKQLMELSRKYDLEIKDENGVFYAFIKDYNSRQLEISENDNLVVIYSIEGSRSPERIIIYKVFKK